MTRAPLWGRLSSGTTNSPPVPHELLYMTVTDPLLSIVRTVLACDDRVDVDRVAAPTQWYLESCVFDR
jgi:hypothetical protein